MNALFGKKIGMTRVFDAKGQQVPVTVLQAGPCVVVQRKTAAIDGYEAAQLGFGEQKEQRLTRPEAGHLKKHGSPTVRTLGEIRLEAGDDVKQGQTITVEILKDTVFVDVTGITKGRGFQGVVKRHNMSGQPAAHGHTMHRRIGSVGMREMPGRILRNKRMPGHMGNVQVTTQHLQVVQVRPEDHLLLVLGSVPGPAGGLVEIRKSIKKASK